jgi:hypothetical protein
MHEYSIETDGRGGFQVRVTNPTGEQIIVPASLTWRETSEWVEEQMRLEAEAAEPKEEVTALTAARRKKTRGNSHAARQVGGSRTRGEVRGYITPDGGFGSWGWSRAPGQRKTRCLADRATHRVSRRSVDRGHRDYLFYARQIAILPFVTPRLPGNTSQICR